MLKTKGANGQTTRPIWCQICQTKHSDPNLELKSRKKIVMGSSTLAHLWKCPDYRNPPFHIDFDCIIGGYISGKVDDTIIEITSRQTYFKIPSSKILDPIIVIYLCNWFQKFLKQIKTSIKC